jgi:hypothetical protein
VPLVDNSKKACLPASASLPSGLGQPAIRPRPSASRPERSGPLRPGADNSKKRQAGQTGGWSAVTRGDDEVVVAL